MKHGPPPRRLCSSPAACGSARLLFGPCRSGLLFWSTAARRHKGSQMKLVPSRKSPRREEVVLYRAGGGTAGAIGLDLGARNSLLFPYRERWRPTGPKPDVVCGVYIYRIWRDAAGSSRAHDKRHHLRNGRHPCFGGCSLPTSPDDGGRLSSIGIAPSRQAWDREL